VLIKLSTVIELPSRSISLVAELYWVTPCWLLALPVLTACGPVGQTLALSPVLLAENDGEALPLCMRLSKVLIIMGSIISSRLTDEPNKLLDKLG
jgi:hypothetical protein